jgi:hypothetical protein
MKFFLFFSDFLKIWCAFRSMWIIRVRYRDRVQEEKAGRRILWISGFAGGFGAFRTVKGRFGPVSGG